MPASPKALKFLSTPSPMPVRFEDCTPVAKGSQQTPSGMRSLSKLFSHLTTTPTALTPLATNNYNLNSISPPNLSTQSPEVGRGKVFTFFTSPPPTKTETSPPTSKDPHCLSPPVSSRRLQASHTLPSPVIKSVKGTPAGPQMKILPRRPSKRGMSRAKKLLMTDTSNKENLDLTSPLPKRRG